MKILANEFLHMDVEKVELLDIPSCEAAQSSYEQNYAPFVNAKMYRMGESSEN